MLNMRILGTGQGLPERVVTTEELAARVGVDPAMVTASSGVLRRRFVRDDEDPVELGATALRSALAAADLEAGDLDVLIHASGSFPQPIPDGSAHFAEKLGLTGISAFSVHATCVSAVVALHQAALLIHTGQARHVAIVSCEVASRGLDMLGNESTFLFGDGAAAMVLGPAVRGDQGVEAYRSEVWPAGAASTEIRGGGYRRPGLDERVDRADFAFRMEGRQVLRLAREVLPGFLERLRPGLSTGLAGVDRVIPHQASAIGLKMHERLGWPADRMETTLADLGNVIAASIPLTLHHAVAAGRIVQGDRVLLVGTGAGLNTTGLVLRW